MIQSEQMVWRPVSEYEGNSMVSCLVWDAAQQRVFVAYQVDHDIDPRPPHSDKLTPLWRDYATQSVMFGVTHWMPVPEPPHTGKVSG